MKKKKYVLVLSGGGFKGAFQLGALNYLAENWSKINPEEPKMKFDLIAGVSVGSLNGAMVAMDKMEELNKLWKDVAENGVKEIYTSDFINTDSQSDDIEFDLDINKLAERLIPDVKLNFWTLLKLATNRKKLLKKAGASLKENLPKFKSIADNTPLRKKLEQLFDKDSIKDTQFYCGFVSLDKGEYYAVSHEDFTTNDDFINGVIASTAMPIIWKPVPSISFLNEQVYASVDGGIKNVSPLGDVISVISKENDPDTEYVIFVINTSCCHMEEQRHEESNIAQIAVRSLVDIAINEIFNNDLRQFVQVNDILQQLKERNIDVPIYDFDYLKRERSDRKLQSFNAIIIHPGPRVLGDTLAASKSIIERRMKHGEQRAKQAVKEFLNKKENPMALVVD